MECNEQPTVRFRYVTLPMFKGEIYRMEEYLKQYQNINKQFGKIIGESLQGANLRIHAKAASFIEDYEAEKQIEKIINGEDEIKLQDNQKIYQYDLRNIIHQYV